jgi:hypothetical protein
MATMTPTVPRMQVKKTTFTEVIPAESSPTDAQPSKFYADTWENVVNKLTQAQWTEHLVRVYRAGEKWEQGAAPVDNVFTGPFDEADIRARFGGGKFILWMLGPPKKHTLVAKWQVELEGAPIINSVPRNGNGATGSDSVAIEAMRMYANPEFMRMQMQMMMTAATEAMTLIKTQIPAPQDPLATLRNAKEILGLGGPSPMDEINKMLMQAMVQKLLNPPETNSLDATLSLVEKIKTSGLFGGPPKADFGSMFASNIPLLVNRFVDGIKEFRLQTEAQERTVRLQRGEIRPNDPNVIDISPPPTNTATANPPAATNGGTAIAPEVGATAVTPEVAQAVIAQSHLHRLVAGIKNPKSTGQDMYDYLRNAWPEILDELAKMSKETLLAFFKNREAQMQYFGSAALSEVADDPRLPKMLEDFLRIARENAELEKSATPPAGVV